MGLKGIFWTLGLSNFLMEKKKKSWHKYIPNVFRSMETVARG